MAFFAIIWSATVFCGPAPEPMYAGWTYWDVKPVKIALRRDICDVLKHPSHYGIEDVADSIFVLAHEEGHAHDEAKGTYDRCGVPGACEAFADCWGARHMYLLARRLGFALRDALTYARFERDRRSSIGYSPIPKDCFGTLASG